MNIVTGFAVCNLDGSLLARADFKWTEDPATALLFASQHDARMMIGELNIYGLHVVQVSAHRPYNTRGGSPWSLEKYRGRER